MWFGGWNGWRACSKADGGAKEIEVTDLARKFFPRKWMGQVGIIRKEWIRGIPLTIKLNAAVW